jgi:2-hydroxy-3-keto-5-methylthiopentenyl-1-phosphate phosphatase
MKTAVQIDFDGTVTMEDVSYFLLDTYAGDRWRQYLKDYIEGRISVGAFNREAFHMVKADRRTMTDLVLNTDVNIRPGFKELVDYCLQREYKVIIVSNGLLFYIEIILEKLGIGGIEIHASENEFSPEGMRVRYLDPEGDELEEGLKEAYTRQLTEQGYDVVYIGDGLSDIFPARRARRVFATGDLLVKCREEGIGCIPFSDFYDVIKGLKGMAEG